MGTVGIVIGVIGVVSIGVYLFIKDCKEAKKWDQFQNYKED